jgi:uncharacterized protein (DUF58 family)
MFTQRAMLLGFVGFCFYLIAVVNTLPSFYYVLTWLSLGLLAASLGIALLSLSGLKVAGHFSRYQGVSRLGARYLNSLAENSNVLSSTYAGSMPLFEMTLQNNASLNKTGIILELQFRSLLDTSDLKKVTPIEAHQFLLEAIPAGQTLDISLPMSLLPRGRHELVQARLIGSDVLGLFRISRRLKLASQLIESESEETKPRAEVEDVEIVVAPPIFDDVVSTRLQGAGHGLSGSRRSRQFGRGEDVRALRPYIAGDDLRHIHWKTTARTGSMVVKEWEFSSRSNALVVWDGSLINNTSFNIRDEVGLSVAASLVSAYHRSELPCSVVLLGGEATFLQAGGAYGGALSSSEITAFAGALATRTTTIEQAFEQSGCNDSQYDVIYLIAAQKGPSVLGMVRRWISRGAIVFVILLDEVPENTKKRGRAAKRKKRNTLLNNTDSVSQDSEAIRSCGASVAEISLQMLAEESRSATLDEISLDSAQLLESEIRRVILDLNEKVTAK